MIKAITLDFWDTIYKMDFEIDLNGLRIEKLMSVLKNYNIDIPQENIIKVYKKVHSEFDRCWIEDHKTMTTREVLEMIFSTINVNISAEDSNYLVSVFQEAILSNPPALITGVKETIIKLSSQYKLGIISDTGFSPGIILRKILESDNILNYFSILIFSDEFGKAKPNSSIFNFATKELQVEQKEIVHIGDNERTDVFGAMNAGMNGIWFLNGKDLPPKLTTPTAIMQSWNECEKIIKNL
jgi:putative hydrolase of the HAD superfamily